MSYYFAPVFVMMLSPFILKEKLSTGKAGCIVAAMIGLFFIVNVGGTSSGGTYNHFLGILYGLTAAIFYASVILLNKFIRNLSVRTDAIFFT